MYGERGILKSFQKFDGTPINEVSQYVEEWLIKYPKGKVAVGTDSLRIKKKIGYATAIAFFYPSDVEEGSFGKGAHVIYCKVTTRNKLEFWTRLWTEMEHTREVSESLLELPIIDIKANLEVHIDINPNDKWDSYRLYKAGVGYFKGMGYNVVAKPDGWVAKCAADRIVR